MNDNKFSIDVQNCSSTIDIALGKLTSNCIVQRIWSHDHTVWKPKPTEITDRLAWLHSPGVMMERLAEIHAFVNEIQHEGFTHALLLGMGGSSLAPEVFRRVFGVKARYLDLSVLDSTHPDTVLLYTRNLNPEKTLYIVSTKSGGTIETISLMKYFYNHTLNKLGREQVGRHFIAITDPKSGLESLAKELKFRKVFLNDPDIGGRYSALSFFGLVPAGLIGVDLKGLLERAQSMADHCGRNEILPAYDNSAAVLGGIMGNLAQTGRDKLTFILSPAIESFGAWVEQLIAESTGKEGVGILPVVGETVLTPQNYANDRIFVYLEFQDDDTYGQQVQQLIADGFPLVKINCADLLDSGSEFFRWQMATAIAAHVLKINPFDQPNVETSKILARKMVTAYQHDGKLPEFTPAFQTNDILVFTDEDMASIDLALKKFFQKIAPGDAEGKGRSYVAIQAFLPPTPSTDADLQKIRTGIQKKYRLATTVGYGPRFLHSTGQLHKGDAGNGLFIQITGDPAEDVPIPDQAGSESSSISFGILLMAQALGDYQALLDAKRKVIRFHLLKDVHSSLAQLVRVFL